MEVGEMAPNVYCYGGSCHGPIGLCQHNWVTSTQHLCPHKPTQMLCPLADSNNCRCTQELIAIPTEQSCSGRVADETHSKNTQHTCKYPLRNCSRQTL